MIFVTGPLFAGKREYIRKALSLREEELAARAVWDVQELAHGGAFALFIIAKNVLDLYSITGL